MLSQPALSSSAQSGDLKEIGKACGIPSHQGYSDVSLSVNEWGAGHVWGGGNYLLENFSKLPQIPQLVSSSI